MRGKITLRRYKPKPGTIGKRGYNKALKSFKRASMQFIMGLASHTRIDTGMSMASLLPASQQLVGAGDPESSEIGRMAYTGKERTPLYTYEGVHIPKAKRSFHKGYKAGKKAGKLLPGGPKHFRMTFTFRLTVYQQKLFLGDVAFQDASDMMVGYIQTNTSIALRDVCRLEVLKAIEEIS